jgi:SlyX protein
MTDNSDRLTDMEVRYSHQARLLDELNDELTAANMRIDELVQEVRTLREMLGSLAPHMEESPDE